MSEKKKSHLVPIIIISAICLVVALGVVALLLAFGFLDLGLYIPLVSGKSIAVIDLKGSIYDSKPIIDQLKEYRKNSGVAAIIIYINSPGGQVGPTQEIYQEIIRTREKYHVPVYASMGTVAASGGYYVATACDKIFAAPGTITGSIGVILSFPNMQELFSKIGLKFSVIKTGAYKDIGSPTREMTKEEKALLQGMIDDVYDQFVDAVAEGRLEAISKKLNLPDDMEDKKSKVLERIREIADGRVFSGRQAYENGLVDELGSLEDAIWAVADIEGIQGEPHVLRLTKKANTFGGLFGALFGTEDKHLLDENPSMQYVWK
jgi:protease-4